MKHGQHRKFGSRLRQTLLWACGLFSLCLPGHAQAPAASNEAIVLTATDDIPRLAYARALFPVDAEPSDLDAPLVLSEAAKNDLKANLDQEVARLQAVAKDEWSGLSLMLRQAGVALPPHNRLPRDIPVEVETDAGPIAATIGGTINISGSVLKGFLIGSLEETMNEQFPAGRIVKLATGWEKDPEATAGTWSTRFERFISLLEAANGASVKPETERSFIDKYLNTPPDRYRFQKQADEVLEQNRRVTPEEAFALWSGFSALNLIAEPAKYFLLAHEFGHIALGHSPQRNCKKGIRQELDADAFALALMSFHPLGGELDVRFFYAKENHAPAGVAAYFADRNDVLGSSPYRFGYLQAFRYGMANARMVARDDAVCPFVPASVRLLTAQNLLRGMLSFRLKSVEKLAKLGRERPFTIEVVVTETIMSPEEVTAMLHRGAARCSGTTARLVREVSTAGATRRRITYAVRCGWSAPSLDKLTKSDRVLIGRDFGEAILNSRRDKESAIVEASIDMRNKSR